MSAPEPEKLRKLAEEWVWSSESLRPDRSVDSLTRLLERVIRECAEAACKSGAGCGEPDVIAEIGHRQDCDAPYVLREFGLAPSPESPKEGK